MYVYPKRLGVAVRLPGRPIRYWSYELNGKLGAALKAAAFAAQFYGARTNPVSGRHILAGKGIYRITRAGRARWVAQWQDAVGRSKRKEFSVRRYGEAGAKRLAQAHRQLMVKELLAA